MHRWHSSICQPNPLSSSKSKAQFHQIYLVVVVRCEVFFTQHCVSRHRGGSEVASLCLDETYPSTEMVVFLVWKSVDPMARQVGVVASKTNTTINHFENSNLLNYNDNDKLFSLLPTLRQLNQPTTGRSSANVGLSLRHRRDLEKRGGFWEPSLE